MPPLFLVNHRIISLQKERYIISSCAIGNNIVLKNNEVLFIEQSASIQSFLLSVYQYLKTDYPKFYKMDNLSKLGWLASEVLLNDENIQQFNPEKIGLVLSNADASLDADLKYFQSIKEIPSPALFVYTLPNIVIGEICIRNKFKGENAFFIFEDFNAKFISEYVNNLFDNNIIELCICGWINAMEDDYKAVLYLVSAGKEKDNLLFTEVNMNSIFKRLEK